MRIFLLKNGPFSIDVHQKGPLYGFMLTLLSILRKVLQSKELQICGQSERVDMQGALWWIGQEWCWGLAFPWVAGAAATCSLWLWQPQARGAHLRTRVLSPAPLAPLVQPHSWMWKVKWKHGCSFMERILYSANSWPWAESLVIIIFLREEEKKKPDPHGLICTP